MLIAWIHFLANLILALVVLQLVKTHLLEKDPNSSLGKALAFLC